MKFNVVLGSNSNRSFKRITYANGKPCVEGTPKGVHTDKDISVLTKEGGQAQTYPSINLGKVLYSVDVGDYITVLEKINGTLCAEFYRVTNITGTEIIVEPCGESPEKIV